ncbi:MAG: ABC transporter ATP-binding protein [Myxococcales bacterium]
MPILLVDAVSKSFGAVKVTDGLSFAVDEGETLGILGPNGAGKTTLFNLVTGELRPDAGRIEFRGEDVGELPPHRRCRMGMGRAYQIPKPFGAMTVFENLVTAAAFGGQRREKDTYDDAVEILRQTGLVEKANRRAGGLGLLDRKRLELARALATRPRLLLLDEIAGGLTEHEARQLVAELRRIKSAGVTMLWIEHVVHALFAVADRLLVVHSGRKLAEGEPSGVLADPEVQRVYLGHVA